MRRAPAARARAEPRILPGRPASVARVSSEYRSMRAELPVRVVELVDVFRNPITQIEFLTCLLATAAYSPAPRSVPGPHKPMS